MVAPVAVIAAGIGKVVASKVATAAINKILAIEVQDRSLNQWGEQLVVGLIFGEGLVPELSFEKQVDLRFNQLDKRIDQVNKDIEKLGEDLKKFKWSVDIQFYKEEEEDLWRAILDYERRVKAYYGELNLVGQTATTVDLDQARQEARGIARTIISNMPVNIDDIRARILGQDVGTDAKKVRGLLEVWTNLAIREVDNNGWQDGELLCIYDAIEKKFMQVLLRQVKGIRLLMEAYSVPGISRKYQSGPEYFVKEAYPILMEEVEAFQRAVEAIAINIMPLSSTPLSPLEVPADIAIMLGCADHLTGEILSGRRLASDASLTDASVGQTLTTLPALMGCWGRVIIPGRRWIKRKTGSQEPARLKLIDGQRMFNCNGVLTIHTTKFLSINDKPKGYILYVGGEPRTMDDLLMAHFVPTEALPTELAGRQVDVQLEDQQGNLLAATQAVICQIEPEQAEVPKTLFGSFTIAFTGGAEIRKL